jgi:hypothetical protein
MTEQNTSQCWALCALMPDHLFDAEAWIELGAILCKESHLPRRFAPNAALIVFAAWRDRDPENSHWFDHCDEDQLIAMHEKITEWSLFAENFPDLPKAPELIDDPLAELETALRKAAA